MTRDVSIATFSLRSVDTDLTMKFPLEVLTKNVSIPFSNSVNLNLHLHSYTWMFPIINLAELLPQEKRRYIRKYRVCRSHSQIYISDTLQHTAANFHILQHTLPHLQRTSTHCSTLQHTSTHCITLYLQHIATCKTTFRAWFEFFLNLKIESRILPKWKESNIIWATALIRLLESSVCLSVCLSVGLSVSLSLSLLPPSPPHILPLPSIGHLECVYVWICMCVCRCVCVCVSTVLNSTEWQLGLCLCRCLCLSFSFFSSLSLWRACARASEQARVHCLALACLLALSRVHALFLTRVLSLSCSLSPFSTTENKRAHEAPARQTKK